MRQFWSWFKTSVKVNWFQIGQEILQWERVLSKKELRVSTSSRYSSYSWFIEVFAKLKTKGVILYQHTILMWVTFFFFYRSIMRTKGTINEAFWDLPLVWNYFNAGEGDLTQFWSFYTEISSELTEILISPILYPINKVYVIIL